MEAVVGFGCLLMGGGISWLLRVDSLEGAACVPKTYSTNGVYYETISGDCVETSNCTPDFVREGGMCNAYTSGASCGTVSNGTKLYDSDGSCNLTCDTLYRLNAAGTGCELIRKYVSNIIIESVTSDANSNSISLEEITLYDIDDNIIEYTGTLGSVYEPETPRGTVHQFEGLADNKIHPFNMNRVYGTDGVPLANTVPLAHTTQGTGSNVVINIPSGEYVKRIDIVNRGETNPEYITMILDKQITIKGATGAELSNIAFSSAKHVYSFLIDDDGVITKNASFDPPYYAIPGFGSIDTGYVDSNIYAVVNGVIDDSWKYENENLVPKESDWTKGVLDSTSTEGMSRSNTYGATIDACYNYCNTTVECKGSQYATIFDLAEGENFGVSICTSYSGGTSELTAAGSPGENTEFLGGKYWYYIKPPTS